MDHRRRAQRDRPRRPGDARGEALPAARLERLREPQHRDLRPERRAVVHRPERDLRSARPRSRRAARLPRAGRHRAVRDHDDAARRRLVRVPRREPHRPDQPSDRQGDRRASADAGPGRAAHLVGLARTALGERVERRQARALRPGDEALARVAPARTRAAVRRLRRQPRHRLADRLRPRAGSSASRRRPAPSRAFPLRAGADVRQLLGRPGELWGAESGADRLVVIRG